ncbi:MAG: hypothetical protein AB7P23_05655 [Amphiplicatus sp.]
MRYVFVFAALAAIAVAAAAFLTALLAHHSGQWAVLSLSLFVAGGMLFGAVEAVRQHSTRLRPLKDDRRRRAVAKGAFLFCDEDGAHFEGDATALRLGPLFVQLAIARRAPARDERPRFEIVEGGKCA